nr:hypothetical protein [Bacteroides sp.]
MSLYIETIRLEHCRFHHLPLHRQRMSATISEAFGSHAAEPLLEAALRTVSIPGSGLYKCRVTYDTVIHQIDLEPYTPRPVRTLRIVNAPSSLDYHLKSADRTALTRLAALRGTCDEIIIVKNGLITDTTYTNLLFKAPEAIYTPRTPLLRGTMRQQLLDSGLIIPTDLTPSDITPGNPLGITHAILINAMMSPEKAPAVAVTDITFQTL